MKKNSTNKIAVMAGALSPRAGGMYFSVSRNAQAMSQAGFNMKVFGVKESLFDPKLPVWRGIDIEALRFYGPIGAGFTPSLKGRLAKFSPILIHQHGLWMYRSSIANWARRRLNCKVIISPRGMLDGWALSRSSIKKNIALWLYERENLANAACIHALTEREASAIRALGINVPIAVIPNGISPPISLQGKQPSFLNGDGRKVLLFMARINPKKGLRQLIRAWSLLKDKCPDFLASWCLVLAGWDDGQHLQEVKALLQAEGLQNSVYLPGGLFGEEKHNMLCHASAFILPSFSEGLPMSVLEAFSYGLPCLITEECNLPSSFDQGAATKIAPTEESILAALEGLMSGNMDLAEMSRAASELAREFDWAHVDKNLCRMAEWVIEGGCPPDFVRMT